MRALDIASVCHAANRAVQQLTGEEVNPEWADAPGWMHESAEEGVMSALEGMTPRELHGQWAASRRADGWVYGEVKDAGRKTHPCLTEYGELPEIQRVKDDLFIAIVNALKDSDV